MTMAGVILGRTAAYMPPEQAKGRPADKRSDIWVFGCVLLIIGFLFERADAGVDGGAHGEPSRMSDCRAVVGFPSTLTGSPFDRFSRLTGYERLRVAARLRSVVVTTLFLSAIQFRMACRICSLSEIPSVSLTHPSVRFRGQLSPPDLGRLRKRADVSAENAQSFNPHAFRVEV